MHVVVSRKRHAKQSALGRAASAGKYHMGCIFGAMYRHVKLSSPPELAARVSSVLPHAREKCWTSHSGLKKWLTRLTLQLGGLSSSHHHHRPTTKQQRQRRQTVFLLRCCKLFAVLQIWSVLLLFVS